MSYRFVVHDDMMAGTKIGWAISFIMANLGTVLMFFVTILVCGLITGAMGIIPIVGGMFGAAIGQERPKSRPHGQLQVAGSGPEADALGGNTGKG